MTIRKFIGGLLAVSMTAFSCAPAQASGISYQVSDAVRQRSVFYKPTVIREARAEYGLNAPIPMFAAQIHQESLWRKGARSKYANGLTQFTPSTERWIKQLYPQSLGWGNSFNPKWAIRALVKYDHWLYQRIKATDACNRWAFALAAYNGGLGWINRDKRLTAKHGKNHLKWWGHVEKYSRRARWAFKENRGYPRKIIYQHQRKYQHWGGRLVCL